MYITVLYSLLRIMDILSATLKYWALIHSFGSISPEQSNCLPSARPSRGTLASESSKIVRRQG